MREKAMTISIEASQKGLIVRTPYSSLFVSELKRLVPAGERQFDGWSKVWIVSPQYGSVIQKLIMTVFKEAVAVPVVKAGSNRLERAEARVEYIGQCKQRADGSVGAYGHDGQSWAYVLPESVLKSFFGQDVEIGVEGEKPYPTGQQTLYSVLLIKPGALQSEIKAAHRRLARLTHPDVNHEPDAKEKFQAVQHAYEILSDPMLRRRYDAGLALEASLNKKQDSCAWFAERCATQFFRSPLRCGLLTVDGEQRLGRVVVSRIYDWRDITDEQGRTLVTSWPFGAETFERRWV